VTPCRSGVIRCTLLSPAAKRGAVDMLKDTLSMSEWLACKAVGLARCTYRSLPRPQTLADPDAQLRACLRAYATKHPCDGFRRTWSALRYDEGRVVNKKKVGRLSREEGLQMRSPRKRAGISSVPPVVADAPNVVWAIDFQFDSTVDGKAIKIASMLDEHTRMSVLNIVERSITGERVVTELVKVFAAAGGPPKVLRVDNGPEFISQALQQFCARKVGMVYIPPDNRGTKGTSNRSTTDYAGSASTATTGTRCWRPAWSSATSTRAQPPTPPAFSGVPLAIERRPFHGCSRGLAVQGWSLISIFLGCMHAIDAAAPTALPASSQGSGGLSPSAATKRAHSVRDS
jgi:putative transposase